MKNENPINSINEKKLSQAEISELANQIAAGVEAGLEDPLELLIKMNFLSKAIEEARKKILPSCLEELDLHGQKASISGVNLTQKEAGVRYNFSNCEIWNQKDKEVKKITEERKDLEGRLKGLKKPETILDEETGELIKLVPPSKTSSTTIEIRFPKQ